MDFAIHAEAGSDVGTRQRPDEEWLEPDGRSIMSKSGQSVIRSMCTTVTMTDPHSRLGHRSEQRQLSLLGTSEPLINDVFHMARRQQLDATSWVELIPGFLSGGDTLIDRMLTSIPWAQHQRWMYNRKVDEPRMTAEYPHIDDAPDPTLRLLASQLSENYGIPYDGLWLNLYRNERDSTGWHGDWSTCKRTECIVPVLTLGAQRRFLLKARSGGPSTVLLPANGDLVVMGGRCQRDWRHCVPKQTRPSGVRISVNFQSSWQMIPEG